MLIGCLNLLFGKLLSCILFYFSTELSVLYSLYEILIC